MRIILENRFNITLTDTGTPLHQPITRFYSQEAKQLIKFGTTIVENIGSIDNSPPERILHEEYFGKDLAKQRLRMSIKISRLEQQLDDIDNKLTQFNDCINRLISSLRVRNNLG